MSVSAVPGLELKPNFLVKNNELAAILAGFPVETAPSVGCEVLMSVEAEPRFCSGFIVMVRSSFDALRTRVHACV